MSTTNAEEVVDVAHASDPIRIVPLHVPEALLAPLAAAPVPAPHLTYRGGPLLTDVKVFTVYWGAALQTDPQLVQMATKLDQFFGYVLTSPLLDQMAEYSQGAQAIGHGSWIGRTLVTAPAPQHVVSDAKIQHLITRELAAANGGVPAPDANTLYFVYLPPGVAVVQGGDRSCQAFCGYHNNFTQGGIDIFYAAMPYPGCQGCTGNLAPFDALTSTSSHELCEAVTDPIPGQGWYDDVHGEIGDICAWRTKKLGTYTVQLEWSNNANACV
jgi:hypothetical protein